jgi:hypothetical protein
MEVKGSKLDIVKGSKLDIERLLISRLDGVGVGINNLIMFHVWPAGWAPDLVHEEVLSTVNAELWHRWGRA